MGAGGCLYRECGEEEGGRRAVACIRSDSRHLLLCAWFWNEGLPDSCIDVAVSSWRAVTEDWVLCRLMLPAKVLGCGSHKRRHSGDRCRNPFFFFSCSENVRPSPSPDKPQACLSIERCMNIAPCTQLILAASCLCVRTPQVTYTSLLTQCARLGQADRAGIVLDELNKRRPSSSSGGGGGRGTGIGDVAPKEAAGRGPSTGMAGTASGATAGSENVSQAFFSGGAGTTAGTAGIGIISGPNTSPPPVATAEAITRGDASIGAGGGGAGGSGGSATTPGGGAWRMDRKLESDLLQLFGQADQVDAAFKVREGSGRGQRKEMVARSTQGEEKLLSFLVMPLYRRRRSGAIFGPTAREGWEKWEGCFKHTAVRYVVERLC